MIKGVLKLETFHLISLIFTAVVILTIFVLKILIAKRTGINCASAIVGLVIYLIGIALIIVFNQLSLLLIFTPISLVMILFQHFITLSAYSSVQDEESENNFSFSDNEEKSEIISGTTSQISQDEEMLDIKKCFFCVKHFFIL